MVDVIHYFHSSTPLFGYKGLHYHLSHGVILKSILHKLVVPRGHILAVISLFFKPPPSYHQIVQ
jgi:hypothetical protein